MSDNIRDEQFLADIRSAAQGEATEYNLEPIIRKEFYYKDIITALQNGGGGGGGFTPTSDQLAAMNSGITEEKVANYDHIVTSANSKTYYLQPEQPTNPQEGDIWIH